MVDVLLVQPPIRDFYLTRKRTIPYGLACIAAALERAGISVEILDGLATARSKVVDSSPEMAELERYYVGPDQSPFSLFHRVRHYGYSFEHIANSARQADPLVVGISSLFTAYADMALETARRIRGVCPEARIVLGGHHPTSLPESVLKCDAVDFVLRGEGEVSLPQLVNALKEGTDLMGIPGIGFRKRDGSFYINRPAVMGNPDDYPPPASHLLKNEFYSRAQGQTAVVMTSRGCPMRCSYCSMACGSVIRYRIRGGREILDEIDMAVNNGARFIDFEDENLTLQRQRFLRLLEQLIARYEGLNLELRAMNGLYPPSLDEELIRLMHRAGFRALNLSLCTTSPAQLQRFRRADVTREFDRVLAVARELGMESVGYLIVGAPGQDPLESVADILYLAQRPVLAGVSVFYPAPGSADFQFCLEQGLLPPSEILYRSSAIPISDTTSRLESITLLRLGRILNFMSYLNGRAAGISPLSGGNRDQRTMVGFELLQRFFQDGLIRGVKADGTQFVHETATQLTRLFVDRFRAEGNRCGHWKSELLNRICPGVRK